MVLLALLSLAMAAPPNDAGAQRPTDDFVYVRTNGDCVIAQRPRTADSPVTLRATCTWPEQSAAAISAKLADPEVFSKIVPPISVSRVERVGADGQQLIYQLQQLWPLSDREVLVWMTWKPGPDGALDLRWQAAPDEPLTLRKGAVRTPVNSGHYVVTPIPSGGATVVHEIAIDGGGGVPEWIVEMVRTRGFAKVLANLRALP